jgi:hypothetical protein
VETIVDYGRAEEFAAMLEDGIVGEKWEGI